MKKYVSIAVITLPAGTLMGLSADQAGARRHALEPVEKGVYRAAAPVQFKRGEIIGLDTAPPKGLADELIDEEEAARRAEAEAKKDQAAAAAHAQMIAEVEAAAIERLLVALPDKLRAQVEAVINPKA